MPDEIGELRKFLLLISLRAANQWYGADFGAVLFATFNWLYKFRLRFYKFYFIRFHEKIDTGCFFLSTSFIVLLSLERVSEDVLSVVIMIYLPWTISCLYVPRKKTTNSVSKACSGKRSICKHSSKEKYLYPIIFSLRYSALIN